MSLREEYMTAVRMDQQLFGYASGDGEDDGGAVEGQAMGGADENSPGNN